MKLLAGTCYDPTGGAVVSAATSSLLAMTALDTTNLRLTFTVPSNGSVMIRMRTTIFGATTVPQILLGVLDHSNSDVVKARVAPLVPGNSQSSATGLTPYSALMIVTGLTAGTSLVYDAAYGVEVVVAATAIQYGGPDNTTVADAAGGFAYEIWDTPGLLASAVYDPSSVATKSTASLVAMTAIDTTNLRVSFVAPSSGIVLVRLRGTITNTSGSTLSPLWGVLDGATVRLRVRGAGARNVQGSAGTAATDQFAYEATGLVTGLTPGTTYTWDAAYGVEGAGTTSAIKMGGPNNTTTNDAWGQFAFDVWNVDDLPRAIGSVS